MKFFTLLFVIICGVQFISSKSVEPRENDISLLKASVIDEIFQLVQQTLENLATQTEQFIQKLQENLQNIFQTADETLDKYANATTKQVNDLIGDSALSCLDGKQTEIAESIGNTRTTIHDCHLNALDQISDLQTSIRNFQDSVRILMDEVTSQLEDCSLKPGIIQKIACAMNNANLITQGAAKIIENSQQKLIDSIIELDRIRQENAQCVASAQDNGRSSISNIIQEVRDCLSSAN